MSTTAISTDACCCSTSMVTESPLACNLGAFTAAERPRYTELRRKIATAVVGKRELQDGFAFTLTTERIALAEVAEWIAFERRCCPFLEFKLEVAREAGAVTLNLSGRPGVKEFLAQAFSG